MVDAPKFNPGDEAFIESPYGYIYYYLSCTVYNGTRVVIVARRTRFRGPRIIALGNAQHYLGVEEEEVYDYTHDGCSQIHYGRADRLSPVAVVPRSKCICPLENFSWNGSGCVCGGA